MLGFALASARHVGQSAPVQFVLTSEGLGAILLGTTREEARDALSSLGDVVPFSRGAKLTPGELADWLVRRNNMAIFVYCNDTGFVNAIEVASPGHGIPATDQVTFDGVDLFIDPADAVSRSLRERGHSIDVSERGYTSTVPNVLLALWRDGDPFDEQARLPMYFESALIARPGYYD